MARLFCGHGVIQGKVSGIRERSGNASKGWAGGGSWGLLAPMFQSLLAERRYPDTSKLGWLKLRVESRQ